MGIYEYFVVFIYLLNTLLLFMYGFHYYLIVYLYHRRRISLLASAGLGVGAGDSFGVSGGDNLGLKESLLVSFGGEYPFVTVQIPIYNELYVSERIVSSVMKFDYPRDRFEVQVLDDSTDETREILESLVSRYRGEGFLIDYIHREDRVDHKAGALRGGLEVSRGEYLAIFDCDFVPPSDFLLRTLPHFALSEKLGLVQTRWGHLNKDYSSLTRAQSLGVDGHFVLEQATRSDYSLWLNFNGTAGVWRKSCILDAGNWSGDTLTEDLDLSYRAQMRGWEFKFLSDVVCPAELPVDISGYKGQQFRWAKGSIQTAVKLLKDVLRSRYPLKKRLEALVHLTYYSVHPLMVFNLLWILPLMVIQRDYFGDFTIEGYPVLVIVGMLLMFLGTFAPSFFFMYSQKCLTGSWTKRLSWLPYLFLYGIGIAVHITKAFIEAVIGRRSAFIRTPKYSIVDDKGSWFKKRYTVPVSGLVFVELGFGIFAFVVAYYAIDFGIYFSAIFPLIFAFSFSYVSLLSMYQGMKRAILYKKRSYNSSVGSKL